MVLRPSLGRVVPGSVPPWRALCAESARALKAFLLPRFLGQGLLLARGPRAAGPRRSFCGLASLWREIDGRVRDLEDSLLESQMQLGRLQYPRNPTTGASERFHFLSVLAGGPGLGSSRSFFVASIRAAGQCFSWPRRGFPLPAIKKARRPFIFAWSASKRSWLCAAQNAATQLNANSKSSPSR